MINIDFLNNEYDDSINESEKIENSIAIDILTGHIKGGSRLMEDKLCNKYNISRTPLRQILNRLAAKGFIELIPNRGAIALAFTPNYVEDCFNMRTLLYPQCVKWAIQRITDEEFSILEETFSFMEFYTATNDMSKMHKINRGFESIIYNACHNIHMEQNLLKLDFIIRYANEDIIYPHNYLTTVLEEHRAIFQAFKEKNSEAGFEAAQIHAYKSMLRRK